MSAAKHGEAIGLLRRAITLGASEAEALPLLAQSLAARDQNLAAMVCIERARAAGAGAAILEPADDDLRERLGSAWPSFQAWLGGSASD